MSQIANAPTTPNDGGFEKRVILSKPIVAKMAGHNDGGYEKHATQESGTH